RAGLAVLGPANTLYIYLGTNLSLNVQGGNSQATSVFTSFSHALEALVVDSSGAPVPNVTVNFSAPSSGGAYATLSAPSATTNSTGIASVTATANSIQGSYAVTATTNFVSSSISFSLTNTASVPATISILGGNGQ